jgi:hypothetical protein
MGVFTEYVIRNPHHGHKTKNVQTIKLSNYLTIQLSNYPGFFPTKTPYPNRPVSSFGLAPWTCLTRPRV